MRAALKFGVLLLVLIVGSVTPAAADDSRLVGVWKAVSYVLDGKRLPMQGLMIFTEKYYSGNTRFKVSAGPNDDANGNAGPYVADGKRVVFTQWVQIHVRPGNAKEPILSIAGPDEATEYRIEGNRLIMTFPSGNEYVLERLDP